MDLVADKLKRKLVKARLILLSWLGRIQTIYRGAAELAGPQLCGGALRAGLGRNYAAGPRQMARRAQLRCLLHMAAGRVSSAAPPMPPVQVKERAVQKANWPGRGGPKVRTSRWMGRQPPRLWCPPVQRRVSGGLDASSTAVTPSSLPFPQGGDTIAEHLDTEEVVDKLPTDQLAPPVPEVVR